MSTNVRSHRKTESVSSVNSNLLAEQFERDRKSIIYYCFTKHGVDNQGHPIHQYYTHVRVIEDQLYNNSKPPPDYHSVLTNKKKRILIVSYNKQLKEPQLHKARENADGSIQIGRTWSLKELKQVINNPDNKEGFLLTMNKLYYWETNSGRERTAFIKTLVKIFMDHFGNHVPELIGWDLGMWYLNEASYKRALLNEPSAKSQNVKGLNVQPIVNQRITSNLPVQDTLTTSNSNSLQQKSDSKNYHRRSPSVQGKPLVESIQENDHNDNMPDFENKATYTQPSKTEIVQSLSKLNQPLEKKDEAIKSPLNDIPSTVFGRKTQPLLGSSSKSKTAAGPLHTPEVSNKIAQSESAILETSEFMDVYDDLNSQPLKPVSALNHQSKAHEKSEYVLLKTENTSIGDIQLEKTLEKELINLHSVTKSTDSPVTNISIQEQMGEDEDNFLDTDFNNNPIEFESVETEKTFKDLNNDGLFIETKKEQGTSQKLDEIDVIDEEALLQIVDAINWSKEDDMRTLVDKFENKYLSVASSYTESLIKICDDYNIDNKKSEFNRVVSSINMCYENVEKVQTLFKTEFSKYEDETYKLMKADDNIQITSGNKKQIITTLKKVIKDVNIASSDLLLLKETQISTEKLYEIEPVLEKLSVALLVIRGASQKIKDVASDETWAYNLSEIREKSELYENACNAFIERFLSFFNTVVLKRLQSKFSLSEITNIIPYNGILLFIKLVSDESYQKILSSFNECLSKIYSKLIADTLYDLQELIRPRKATISVTDSNEIQSLFSSSKNTQKGAEIISTMSNQSSTIALSNRTSSINLLEFKNLESLLSNWKQNSTTKKLDILKSYNEPFLLLKVLKSLNFLKSLPMNYQNFILVFFHINDYESSTSMLEFLKKYKVPSQRIINLNLPMPSNPQQKTSTFELKWNLCNEMFNFKLSNFNVVITNLLKATHGHLLNSLMLFVENELLSFANAKETQDFLFIQSIFKKLLYKIKTDLEEFVKEKSIALDKFNLSITKDNLRDCSQKFICIVQDFIMYFYTVKQDLKFLAQNLPIENFNLHDWETQRIIEQNYLNLSSLILRVFASITKLLKENSDTIALSTNTLLMENDSITESIVNMNFLNNYCIDFLSFIDDEKLTSTLLATVKKEHNEFFKLNLSEILIKDNLLKLYVFVKSAWAIINSNNTNENDPSKYVAYSGNNLNQILVDYDTEMVTKIIKNIYVELDNYVKRFEKLLISQLQDQQSISNLALITEYIQIFTSKVWSNIQGDCVSFFLKLYSLIDKYYSKGPNKIETSLQFNKNDIIQAFMNIKKENQLP